MEHYEDQQPGLNHLTDLYDRSDLFRLLDNDDIVRLSRLSDGKGFSSAENVLRATGIATRRVLCDGLTELDLAIELCDRLESRTGLAMRDFSAVLLCHSHTNNEVTNRLTQSLIQRFQLAPGSITGFNFGCAGFLKLLQEGMIQLADSTDPAIRIALLNVETPETWHDASDRLFCGIVSAGATAAVLQRGHGIPISAVRADDFLVDPELRINAEPLFRRDTTDSFDFQGNSVHRCVMRMNAEPVFINGIELMLQNLRAALAFADVGPDDRVIVVPHQPSGKLLKALIAVAKTEFPQCELLNNLASFGNTISASVPSILSRLSDVIAENGLKSLKPGDHIILLAAGICMTRISDHMSAGHACLRWRMSPRNEVSGTAVVPVAMLGPAWRES